MIFSKRARRVTPFTDDGASRVGDAQAALNAVDGSLVFDGTIADSIQAGIIVRGVRFIDFLDGWIQGFSGVGFSKHVLKLNGGLGEQRFMEKRC